MNNQSFDLIKYKYQIGVYDIQKMKDLVFFHHLSEEEFFEITRTHYKK